MASNRQQWQWLLVAGIGSLAGAIVLFICCCKHHDLIPAEQPRVERFSRPWSCLQRNASPPRSEYLWLHESLCTPLFHRRLPIPHKTTNRSCSWQRFLFRDVMWQAVYRIWKAGTWKLLGLLVVALVARELLAYMRHLQHADPDALECSCKRHKQNSLSRTACCTFSAHRQDLHHLLQVLAEEAVSLREELTDRIRLSTEIVKVKNLLEEWSVRYTKMLRAKAFIKGYRKGEAKGRRLASKEGHAAGFVAGEQKGRLKGHARGWIDGYEKGKKKGFRRGRREGYGRGYRDGCGEGKPHGKAEAGQGTPHKTRLN